MPMHNFNFFPQYEISKYGKEGKYSGKRRLSIDDEERNVIDLQTVGEIADSCATFVGVGDYDNFMAPVDEFGRELVDVGFDAAGLREEEVADHGDVVGHCEDGVLLPGKIIFLYHIFEGEILLTLFFGCEICEPLDFDRREINI